MRSDSTAQSLGDRAHVAGAGQQWLAAMQDDLHVRQMVGASMLSDPASSDEHRLRRHPVRLPTPGVVGHFVHVAVVAGQIAPASDFDHELPER